MRRLAIPIDAQSMPEEQALDGYLMPERVEEAVRAIVEARRESARLVIDLVAFIVKRGEHWSADFDDVEQRVVKFLGADYVDEVSR